MGKITVKCPNCLTTYSVDQQSLGRMGRCAKCEGRLVFATAAPPSPALAMEASAGQTVEQEAESGIEPGMAPPQREDVSAGAQEEKDVPADWSEGGVILDLYEVKAVLGEGGFGKVYQVRHRNWNIDLAVKSPLPGKFTTESQRETFIRECETWIKLGLHPNIVSCHYVRTLNGIPRVFAEYVEGGSLKDWIDDRKLYEGSQQDALKRILDVAIQFAGGLHYAHEHEGGLVHQDVKPANVLMTPDGAAEVSDFGLAQARAAAAERESPAQAGRSMLVPGAGFMTREYASPEQAAGQPLTRKTDIWSWGVSILHMFTGELTWMVGQAAAEVLQGYLETGAEDQSIPRMPDALAGLLRHCFQDKPDDRPKDMQEIAGRLKEIYREAIGQDYAREEPKAAELLADALNNRAVSMLDLGKKDEAEKLFDEALKADPHHPEATFNSGITQWRAGQVTDQELVQRMESLRASHTDDWRDEYLLGLVHIERGDARSAAQVLEEAARRAPGDDAVASELQAACANLRTRINVAGLEMKYGDSGSVQYCPDGQYVLRESHSRPPVFSVWELATQKRLCELDVSAVHEASGACYPIFAAPVVSADRRWVIAGTRQGAVCIWNLPTGRCLRILKVHTGLVSTVCVSREGRFGVSGSDKTLRMWDVATGERLGVIGSQEDEVACVCLSLNGRRALSGGRDGTLYLWDIETRTLLNRFKGHSHGIQSVSFDSNVRLARSTGGDRVLRLWEAGTGTCTRTFRGHVGVARLARLSGNGKWALSMGYRTVRLWKVETERCLRTLESDRSAVEVLYASCLRACSEWERKRPHEASLPCVLPIHDPTIAVPLALSHGYPTATDPGRESTFRKYLSEAEGALEETRFAEAHALALRSRSVPGYERHPEALDLWSRLSLKARRRRLRGAYERRTLEGHTRPVHSLSMSVDGTRAMSAPYVGDVPRIWHLTTGEHLAVLEGHEGFVRCVALSADGR